MPFSQQNVPILAGCMLQALVLIFMPSSNLLAQDLTQPVAKVNDVLLVQADLEKALNQIMPATSFHGGMHSRKRDSFRSQAMERMVAAELLFQKARADGIAVEPARIQADLDAHIKRFGGSDRYMQALERAGMTDEQFRRMLAKDLMIDQLLELEVKKKAVATDREVEAFYRAKQKSFFRPEARRIRHILIACKADAPSEQKVKRKAKARKVLAELMAGEEMSALAWKYSDGPYRVKGGDLGLVHKGRLEPAIEKAAADLPLDQFSGIIETHQGYHIIRVEEVQTPKQLTFEEVADKIRGMLTQKKEARLKDELTTRLKSEARIEYY